MRTEKACKPRVSCTECRRRKQKVRLQPLTHIRYLSAQVPLSATAIGLVFTAANDDALNTVDLTQNLERLTIGPMQRGVRLIFLSVLGQSLTTSNRVFPSSSLEQVTGSEERDSHEPDSNGESLLRGLEICGYTQGLHHFSLSQVSDKVRLRIN